MTNSNQPTTATGGTPPPLPPLAQAHLVDGGNNLEQLVVGEVLERELPLRHVPGVRFPEHRVPVPGNHLTRRQTKDNKKTGKKRSHQSIDCFGKPTTTARKKKKNSHHACKEGVAVFHPGLSCSSRHIGANNAGERWSFLKQARARTQAAAAWTVSRHTHVPAAKSQTQTRAPAHTQRLRPRKHGQQSKQLQHECY